jgi:hypothetical protein
MIIVLPSALFSATTAPGPAMRTSAASACARARSRDSSAYQEIAKQASLATTAAARKKTELCGIRFHRPSSDFFLRVVSFLDALCIKEEGAAGQNVWLVPRRLSIADRFMLSFL